MNFSGLKILLIGIGFYDYEQAIVDRIKQRGGHVDYWADTPLVLRKKPWGGIIARIPALARLIQKKHENDILSKINNHAYDKVLFIKGVDISEEFIRTLKDKQPDSEFILYEWDSIKRNPILLHRFKYFNHVYSFDGGDAKEYPFIKFRPLFFRHSQVSEEKIYDIVFIGLMHSSRLNTIREIQNQAKKLDLKIYVYMTTTLSSWIKQFLKRDIKDLHVNNLSYDQVVDINSKSHCVIDLPHPDQKGLTMRAIEALGSNIKIITTSKDISSYDFFDDSMIKIIKSDLPQLDLEFISSCRNSAFSSIAQNKYSLDYWLDDVFDIN